MTALDASDPNFLNLIYNEQTQVLDKDAVFGGPYAGTMNVGALERSYLHVAVRDSLRATRALIRQAHAITPAPLKILALGDSITDGLNSADGTGYRNHLVDLLDQRGINATVVNGGVGGITLTGLAPTVAPLLAANPDTAIVVLAIGTNDAATSDTATWQTRYGNLVDQILATNATVKVCCARITLTDPTFSPTTASVLDPAEVTLNTWVDAVVAARLAGGRVVKADLSTIPSQWLQNGGLHPGDAAYLRMANLFLKAITPWLP